MKRFSEQLNKKAMTVKLRAAEKRELRERVVSYMEYHPLPAAMKANTKATKKSVKLTEEYREVALPWKLMGRWAIGTFALILIAVPFVAERSVPGDGLYAVKKFNEEVRGTLAFDTVQKVEWETERLNRRIAEARLLASEGRLTSEVEAEVADAVRTHSENAQKNIEVLRTEDEDEATLAAIAFETTLSVQSAALQDEGEVDAAGETVPSQPSLLATAVEESRVKSNATNASSTIPAFDKVMAKVEQNTTRAYELLDSLRGTASEEEVAEITRRIQDIERSVQQALDLRQENDEEARTLLINSLQRTQKLIVFMTDIEVSQTVDIETIVPVVLTDAEEQAILTEYQIELSETIEAINTALETEEDEGLVEKSNSVLGEIDTLIEAFDAAVDFKVLKQTITSALDLAQDIYTVLDIDAQGNSIIEVVDVEVGSSTEPVASSTDETNDENNSEEDSTEVEEVTPEFPVVAPSASSTASSTATSTENVDTE